MRLRREEMSGIRSSLVSACKRAGLNSIDASVVLDCISGYVTNESEIENAEEALKVAIRRCLGADDCGLCKKVLDELEPGQEVGRNVEPRD